MAIKLSIEAARTPVTGLSLYFGLFYFVLNILFNVYIQPFGYDRPTIFVAPMNGPFPDLPRRVKNPRVRWVNNIENGNKGYLKGMKWIVWES